jgi:hypothetical protein
MISRVEAWSPSAKVLSKWVPWSCSWLPGIQMKLSMKFGVDVTYSFEELLEA